MNTVTFEPQSVSNPFVIDTTPTGINQIDSLLDSKQWVTPVMTYSFYNDFYGGPYYSHENVAELSEVVKANVRYVIEKYIEPYIKIDFVEVDDTAASQGILRYMFSDGPQGSAYAYAYTPHGNFALSGDVHLAPRHDNLDGLQGSEGSYGFFAILHETLHALGVKHPGNYGEGDVAPFLNYSEDNTTNTVMTYSKSGASPGSLMPYDLLALQHMYGARELNSGDTFYTFNTVFGYTDGYEYWGSSDRPTKVTLFDSGGLDVLDFSNLEYNASGYRFDLNQGGFLTTQDAYDATPYQAVGDPSESIYYTSTFGTAIAYRTTIEQAIGTTSQDIILGNEAANWIEGNDGRDELIGGDGADMVVGGSGNDLLMGGNYYATLNLLVDDAVNVLTGGRGGDVFAVGLGLGYEIVTDFQAGADKIGLTSGIRKSDLSIIKDSGNIFVSVGDNLLAIVEGVSRQLTSADFKYV
jgi:hypothetical protein